MPPASLRHAMSTVLGVVIDDLRGVTALQFLKDVSNDVCVKSLLELTERQAKLGELDRNVKRVEGNIVLVRQFTKDKVAIHEQLMVDFDVVRARVSRLAEEMASLVERGACTQRNVDRLMRECADETRVEASLKSDIEKTRARCKALSEKLRKGWSVESDLEAVERTNDVLAARLAAAE